MLFNQVLTYLLRFEKRAFGAKSSRSSRGSLQSVGGWKTSDVVHASLAQGKPSGRSGRVAASVVYQRRLCFTFRGALQVTGLQSGLI